MAKQIISFALTFLSLQSTQAQGLEWARKLGGPVTDVAYAVVADKNNYVYTTGNFESGADFDPGPGTANLSASGSTDVFIQKQSEAGKFLWAKKIGGSGADSGNGMAVDQSGNIYISGYFSNAVDFDPGPGTFVLSSYGEWDAFVLKLDKNGNFLWVNAAGGSGTDNCHAVAIDPQGNVYVSGSFSQTAYFDRGAGNFSLTAANGSSVFVEKLDADGKFIWAVTGGGTGQVRGRAIAISPDGSLYVTGDGFLQKRAADGSLVWNFTMNTSSSGTALFTDRSGNLFATGYFSGIFALADTTLNINASTTFILKLDPDGKCLLCKTISSPSIVWGYDIDADNYGNIYTTGWFSGEVDFDPGPGTAVLSSTDGYSAFIVKMDAAGNFNWVIPIQATGSGNRVETYSTAIDNRGAIFNVGRLHGTADFDPGTGMLNLTANGFFDLYQAKFSSRVFYQGKVFHDLNANTLQEPGEPNLPNVIVNARDNNVYVSSDENGFYRFYSYVVDDTISVVPPQPYWSVLPDFQIAKALQKPADFAMRFDTVRDICLSVTMNTPLRPNRKAKVYLMVRNIGSVRVDSIPVSLLVTLQPKPEPLIYLSSKPATTIKPGDNYTWLISSLDPGKWVLLEIDFKAPEKSVLGSPVSFSASAFIPNDEQPYNNYSRVQSIILAAFDPNDKQVSPEVVAPTALDTTVLTYVVRFQNTGNYPAELVYIRDTLPPEVDLGSLQILSASHAPYTWSLREGRVLEIRFDPILLPDSTANEPESHGFVAFSLKPKPGLMLGDSVSNRVGIYFDYNDPVITNTAVMKVAIPVGLTQAGDSDGLAFGLRPNPAAPYSPIAVDLPTGQEVTVAVYDMQGRILQKTEPAPGDTQVVLQGLPSGVYWVQVRVGRLGGARLLVVR